MYKRLKMNILYIEKLNYKVPMVFFSMKYW